MSPHCGILSTSNLLASQVFFVFFSGCQQLPRPCGGSRFKQSLCGRKMSITNEHRPCWVSCHIVHMLRYQQKFFQASFRVIPVLLRACDDGLEKALANVTAQAVEAPCPHAPVDIVHSSKVFSPSPLCKAEKMRPVEMEGGFKE